MGLINFQRLGHALGFVFNPEWDADRLPVVNSPQPVSITSARQVSINSKGAVKMKDGKLYERSISENDSGATVYELNSENVTTETNVPPGMTKYDWFVFLKFKRELKPDGNLKYKHMTDEKYKVIKRYAYSQSIDGKPINPRQATEVLEVSSLRGCGERNMKDYYKAMKEAQEMYINKAPLPVDRG